MQTPLRQRKAAAVAACAITAPLIVGFATTPAAFARQEQPAPTPTGAKLVSLDVRDARLEDAINILTTSSGIKDIVLQPAPGRPFSRITLKLSDQPVEKALGHLAAAAGASFSVEEGIYYFRGRAASDAPQVPATPAVPAAPSPAPEAAAPVAPEARRRGAIQTVRIPLMYALPSELKRAIEEGDWSRQMDSVPHNFPKFGEVRPYVSSLPGQPLFPVPAGAPGEGQASAGGFGAGRDSAPYESAGQRTPGLGGLGGAGGVGGLRGGQGGGQGGVPGGAGGQNNNQSARPEGIDSIFSYDADNVLIVRGDTDAIEELRGLIRFLDVAPRQVSIKAEFVAVNISDVDAFGIDWNFQPAGNIDVNTPLGGAGGGSLTLAYASGNAVANLRATLTRSTSNILQSPIISTTNNREGFISVSDTVTIFVTQSVISNGISQLTTIPIPLQASNGLSVTPHINGDNSITLAVAPQLQTVNIDTTGPGGAPAPRISTQALSTVRRIQSGDTMVLGGFIQRTEVRGTNEVPLLSKLPIIGSLFRARDRRVTGSEVLVFLTPTIIEDRSTGVIGTGGGAPPPTP